MADQTPRTPVDTEAAARLAFANLSRHERRRVMLNATLRMLLSIALLVGVYILTPPKDVAEGTLGAGLIIAMMLLAGLVAWELYRTVRDPYPEVRASTALVVLIVAVIVIFALIYASISAADPMAFTEPLSKEDAIYYTVTTLSTTGFGDIAAVSPGARWVVTSQMLFDLVLIVGLARVFMLAAKAGRARKVRAADAE